MNGKKNRPVIGKSETALPGEGVRLNETGQTWEGRHLAAELGGWKPPLPAARQGVPAVKFHKNLYRFSLRSLLRKPGQQAGQSKAAAGYRSPRLGTMALFVIAVAFALPVEANAYEARLVEGDLNAIHHTGPALLAADRNGDILRSTDLGENFGVARAGSPSEAVTAFGRAGGTIVAVGLSGVVFRSTNDGATWNDQTSWDAAILGDLRDVATNGAGRWVTAGSHFGDCAVLVSDDDGLTWSRVELGVAGSLNGIAWHAAGSRFVAVGSDGGFGARAFSSANGTEWTAIGLLAGTSTLRFISSDGEGGLLAGGDPGFHGSMLISDTPDPDFVVVANSQFSETLRAAAVVETGRWLAGGDETLLVEVTREEGAVVLAAPAPGGEAIGSLVFIAPSMILVTGGLPDLEAPEEAVPVVRLVRDEEDFRLIATGVAQDRIYRVETSARLDEWSIVPGSERIASGPTLEWLLTPDPNEGRRFWRVARE